MELKIAGYEAIILIEKYYTDNKWPLTKFDISNMSCPVDQGDGGVVTQWDIIDLKNEKLIKVNDYYDGEHGGIEKEDAPKSNKPDEYNSLYDEIESECVSAHRTYPTAIYADDLIEAIVLKELNSSGYKRSEETP